MTLDNDKARELFNAARNLPSAERDPFLDKECGDDDSLRDEVEALLEHYDTSQPTAKSSDQLSDTSFEYQPGQMIGSFKILNVLGEGGMGIVYSAVQDKPVHRKVAIKVIKAGMDTKQVIARFEAERQALAFMNHPSISQIYDAGVTSEGRPYFAMEYVKGMAITDACDEQKLNTIQRLELMAKVCDAVQHAHTRTIIHRDLKPSNILVYFDDDDVPQPKIIDFGVAKATSGQKLTEKTLFTQVGKVIGTPAYMSPEQADLKITDIDTRTDVYALGVILYELLSGRLPFDPLSLEKAGFIKRREIICNEVPPTPSTQLSSIDVDEADLIAQRRQTKTHLLTQLLKKDLEWIPLKAIRKMPRNRYSSAKSMAQDIRSYLDGNPLEARPESWFHRFTRMLRKHRILSIKKIITYTVIAVLVVIVAILFNKQSKKMNEVELETETAKQETATAKQDTATAKQDTATILEVFLQSSPTLIRSDFFKSLPESTRILIQKYIPPPSEIVEMLQPEENKIAPPSHDSEDDTQSENPGGHDNPSENESPGTFGSSNPSHEDTP